MAKNYYSFDKRKKELAKKKKKEDKRQRKLERKTPLPDGEVDNNHEDVTTTEESSL
ncbi:hypothetical protein H206_03208 [Candidatus Electrothrix aarhusensis]|uniref:Uncharacterized protein n=1 Tax=Candidatus Electrothrix aarhusensis TaxID=1859131 RepID=A0A444IRS8_9BACT|nr:hypothetical protein H206_03208 [Candidatus Electrothrix aarhusensis]